MREDGMNTKLQEDIAFPAMMEIGTSTPLGDTAVFIYTAASSHIVTAESRLCQHAVNTTACSVRMTLGYETVSTGSFDACAVIY